MSNDWISETLKTTDEALGKLGELRGKLWLSRGQSRDWGGLVPSIDRGLEGKPRIEKLSLERQSIDLFRATAEFFSHLGEETARSDDVIALMVLRHYGVPTRLLDWSQSPYVAAYFAVCDNEGKDGEIWSFDQRLYAQEGKKQWQLWPQTTIDRSGKDDKFRAQQTMFTREEPPDWFICAFYPHGFPRQKAQLGAYTLTARFGVNHADAIAQLLKAESCYRRYVVSKEIKAHLQQVLRERHGIWRGSLFPDSAGAAETVNKIIFRS